MYTTLSDLPSFSGEFSFSAEFSQPPFVSEEVIYRRCLQSRLRTIGCIARRRVRAMRKARATGRTETSPPSIDIDTTLAEPPILPEECTLSQFRFSEDRVKYLPLPPTPPSVCEECWRGPFAMHFGMACMSPPDGKWYRRWPDANTYVTTKRKLKPSANAGCVWCRFIVSCVDFVKSRTVTVTMWGTREKPEEGPCWRQDYQELHVKINGNEYTDNGPLIIYAAPDDPAASYITTRGPILDVKSARVLALAKQAIDECVDKHECCRRAASLSPRLPTRLVDCTDLAHPRLVSASGGEHGQYIALSYVWGKDSEQTPYRTTTSNLSTYEHRIDPRVLPLTIRDAIYVTHTLGFRWLWVDGLCIIQDSDSDKTHEIGRMHHVYRYAHVTIMAGSAEGVSSGFLQERSPPNDFALPFICPPYPPNSTERRYDHSAQQKLQVGQVYLTTSQDTSKAYEDELGCMATRAWCMQECLLSPRALIFTPRTILFRCLTAEADTVGVGSIHYSISGEPRLPTSLFLPPTAPVPEPDSKEWNEMREAWTAVIKDYTRRTASDPSDKLVACAAVAEQFHRALGSEYLAGFWRSDALLIHLLWEAAHMLGMVCERGHARPAAYRAPSWSWAAIDGPTHHYHANQCALLLGDPRTVALAKVTECWVALEHPELRFGRVTDGALVLRGAPILCNSSLATMAHFACYIVPLPSFGEVRHQWQCGLGGLVLDEEDGIYPTIPSYHCAFVTMDVDVDELPGRMWLVPFVRRKCHPFDKQDDKVHGIALELAPPSDTLGSSPKKSRFRRIGYFYDRVLVAGPGEDSKEHPLWDPLTQAVKMGELPWMDIEIV